MLIVWLHMPGNTSLPIPTDIKRVKQCKGTLKCNSNTIHKPQCLSCNFFYSKLKLAKYNSNFRASTTLRFTYTLHSLRQYIYYINTLHTLLLFNILCSFPLEIISNQISLLKVTRIFQN